MEQWSDVTAEMVAHWCWVPRVDRHGRYRRTSQSTARNRQWVASAVFDVLCDLGAAVDPRRWSVIVFPVWEGLGVRVR